MPDEINQVFIPPEGKQKRATFVRNLEVVLPLVVLLVFATLTLFVETAQASYSCNNICHGIVLWSESYTGAQSDAEVVNMSCPAPACNPVGSSLPHIGNVLWLLDVSHHQSSCPYGGACWIEAGYHTVTGSGCASNGTWYYWADFRPGDSHLNVHCLGTVQSGDLGYNAWLYIAGNGGGKWTIQVSPQTNYWSGLSTNNSMSADTIEFGMELLGTSGASANTGYFTYNAFQQSIGGTWSFQTTSGQTHNDSPINSGWTYPPSNSNNGGTFHTGCVC
jgi:hypothetical protein